MSLTATALNIDSTQDAFIVFGQITPSANYGTSGGASPHGDPLDLSQLGVPSSYPPVWVHVWQTVPQGSAARADVYNYLPDSPATQAGGVLQIMAAASGAAPTEITPGGAYSGLAPVNISGYALYFLAMFASL